MKIYNIAKDVKQMQLAELEAVDKRAKMAQATQTDNKDILNETEEKSKTKAKTRSKKNKERLRPDTSGILSET